MEEHGKTCEVVKKSPVWAEKCLQKEGTFSKELSCAKSCKEKYGKTYTDILMDLCDLTPPEDHVSACTEEDYVPEQCCNKPKS